MNTRNLGSEMDAMVCKGQIVEAVERFFDDNTKTRDFATPATETKVQKVKGLTEFVGNIQNVNGITLHHSVAGEDVSMSEFTFDFDMNDGSKILWHEVIRREWKDGKVITEQYFKS